MKKLTTGHTFNLRGVPYICDVLIGLYATSKRPCILLVDSKEFTEGWQETVTTATANPPPGFLQGFQSEYIPFKTWSENEGLLESSSPSRTRMGLRTFSLSAPTTGPRTWLLPSASARPLSTPFAARR